MERNYSISGISGLCAVSLCGMGTHSAWQMTWFIDSNNPALYYLSSCLWKSVHETSHCVKETLHHQCMNNERESPYFHCICLQMPGSIFPNSLVHLSNSSSASLSRVDKQKCCRISYLGLVFCYLKIMCLLFQLELAGILRAIENRFGFKLERFRLWWAGAGFLDDGECHVY